MRNGSPETKEGESNRAPLSLERNDVEQPRRSVIDCRYLEKRTSSLLRRPSIARCIVAHLLQVPTEHPYVSLDWRSGTCSDTVESWSR